MRAFRYAIVRARLQREQPCRPLDRRSQVHDDRQALPAPVRRRHVASDAPVTVVISWGKREVAVWQVHLALNERHECLDLSPIRTMTQDPETSPTKHRCRPRGLRRCRGGRCSSSTTALQRDNPRGLLPAWMLYWNHVYSELVDALGVGNVFILSAGCGPRLC